MAVFRRTREAKLPPPRRRLIGETIDTSDRRVGRAQICTCAEITAVRCCRAGGGGAHHLLELDGSGRSGLPAPDEADGRSGDIWESQQRADCLQRPLILRQAGHVGGGVRRRRLNQNARRHKQPLSPRRERPDVQLAARGAPPAGDLCGDNVVKGVDLVVALHR